VSEDRPRKAPHHVPGEELPLGVDAPPAELDRRELMKLLGAGASLAGLGGIAGCMQPPSEQILPRVEQPPEMVPGVPLSYATSMVLDGFATGLVVQTLEARPIKIEGNPDHPASLGATSAFEQASILDLYDPQRLAGASERGGPRAPEAILRPLARRQDIPGLWFLLGPQSSPLVAQQMQRVRARHPSARFAFHAPLERRSVYRGAALVFGRPLEAQYRFDRARVVVSLDADFMAAMPSSVRWSHDLARRRRLRSPSDDPGRLYVAEPSPTPTGSLADHRAPVAPSSVAALAAGLFGELIRIGAATGVPARVATAMAGAPVPVELRPWLASAAADLAGARGDGVVVAGDQQPAAVHALVHLINQALGNSGRAVWYTRPALIEPLGAGLAEVAAAAAAGQIGMLVIADCNPVYTAPADIDMRAILARVPDSLCLSSHRDETAAACRFSLTAAHYLESWGDARAYDGTVSLVQPMIRPLYRGLTTPELLAVFAGDERPDGYRMLRELHGAPVGGEPSLELAWQGHLRRGFLSGSGFPPEQAEASWSQQATAEVMRLLVEARQAASSGGFEVHLPPSHAVYDGRFAGNGWLQELPRPITKLTWGNAALMAASTAARLGVASGDVVRLERDGRAVEAPVLVVPGQAPGAITLELGYGRKLPGSLGDGVGVNGYPLRPSPAGALRRDLHLMRTGKRTRLATTQSHWSLAGRGHQIARHATLAGYRRDPDFTAEQRGPLPSALPDLVPQGVPQWGMTIDTSICSGCSACVVACQAENNIPLVGAEGVRRSREMHWLRIDTYLVGSEASPDVIINQPMLCQHCERAPCEYVCPTYATQHSPDGLNEMVYNRCIGTRFCSNNCPYKVRRFNWFDYTEDTPVRLRLQRNPNVTVRARGVMEKCTYCVQRIRAAEIAARMERREIRPNEVATACQQACPTRAISFGLLHHEGTEVVEWRRQPRRYDVLHDLGTRPRTVYLAKIVNPKPAESSD